MRTLLVLCGVFVFLSDLCIAYETCLTPNSTNGHCIPLQDCAPLNNIKLNFKTATKAERDLVRLSKCGSAKSMVCCLTVDGETNGNVPESQAGSLLPIPGDCGTETKERILGGERASISDFPWMALIQYSQQGKKFNFNCGASLINSRYVITAAHCVKGRRLKLNNWEPISIRLGENDLRTTSDCEEPSDDYSDQQNLDCADPVVDVPIEKIIVHESYKPDSGAQHNDIALIRMSRSIQSTDFIKPVCLPFAANLKDKNYDNTPLVVAGFGTTENGTQSDVKLKLGIKGANWNHCNSVYQKLSIDLVEQQLCAGGEANKDSCTGDSGGPLMGDDKEDRRTPYTYLAGIVSRGPRMCGTAGIPAVYTRVDKYLNWIVSNVKE